MGHPSPQLPGGPLVPSSCHLAAVSLSSSWPPGPCLLAGHLVPPRKEALCLFPLTCSSAFSWVAVTSVSSLWGSCSRAEAAWLCPRVQGRGPGAAARASCGRLRCDHGNPARSPRSSLSAPAEREGTGRREKGRGAENCEREPEGAPRQRDPRQRRPRRPCSAEKLSHRQWHLALQRQSQGWGDQSERREIRSDRGVLRRPLCWSPTAPFLLPGFSSASWGESEASAGSPRVPQQELLP